MSGPLGNEPQAAQPGPGVDLAGQPVDAMATARWVPQFPGTPDHHEYLEGRPGEPGSMWFEHPCCACVACDIDFWLTFGEGDWEASS